ncbi:MAG TPA: LuxR C-terminal-related transcriptional regulator [Myxococcaceae bacterium]|nr:LuxR C-terminal-related transcriptional regulator [Myxococcaceae bacterium]
MFYGVILMRPRHGTKTTTGADAMSRLEEVLNGFYACTQIDELVSVMHGVLQGLGYVGFAYADLRRLPLSGDPVPFHVCTVSAEFRATYVRESFFCADPVLFRAASTHAPFTWGDCPEFHHNGRRRGPKTLARKIIEVANDFGYTQGFVVPAHSVDMMGAPVSALLSMDWTGDTRNFGTPDMRPRWLRLAVLTFHERMIELRGLAAGEQLQRPTLTDRERECLSWACRGKTNSETAAIIGISERTTEFHIRNAMGKLGVHNKVHAIAIAIRLGLITP